MKWRALAVKRAQLPPLVAAGESLGAISAQAATATGIPEGLPLYAAGADKACEVLASGAMTPSTGNLSYGTTATFNTCNSKYVEPMPFVPPYPAAVPGHYNSEIIVQRGYWMVNWFKREFAAAEVLKAEQQGIEPEVLFEQLARDGTGGHTHRGFAGRRSSASAVVAHTVFVTVRVVRVRRAKLVLYLAVVLGALIGVLDD